MKANARIGERIAKLWIWSAAIFVFAILAFIIIYIVSQFVMVGVMFGSMSTILFNPLMQMEMSGATGNEVPDYVVGAVDTIFLCTLVGTAAIATACWFITRYMLTRKLNLA